MNCDLCHGYIVTSKLQFITHITLSQFPIVSAIISTCSMYIAFRPEFRTCSSLSINFGKASIHLLNAFVVLVMEKEES